MLYVADVFLHPKQFPQPFFYTYLFYSIKFLITFATDNLTSVLWKDFSKQKQRAFGYIHYVYCSTLFLEYYPTL